MKHSKALKLGDQMKQSVSAKHDAAVVIVEGQGSAVSAFLKDPFISACNSSEPVSEREYVDLFLKGINQGELSQRDWIRLLGGAEIVPTDKSVQLPTDRVEYYKSILEMVVSSAPGPNGQITAAKFCAENAVFERLAAVRVVFLIPKDKRPASLRRPASEQEFDLRIEYQVVGVDHNASLDYAFSLLLSKFSSELRRCRWSKCRRFFLGDPDLGRKKQREFCEESHREPQLNIERGERVQAKRAAVTVEQWRDLKKVEPMITPQKWKAIKAASLRMSPEKWIAEQQRKSK
jgi:hypothetical protein